MPELRKDPIHGRWVIISTERSRRPSDFSPRSENPSAGSVPSVKAMKIEPLQRSLPFEIMEPLRTLLVGPFASSPISSLPFGIEGELDREGEGIYDKMNGIGAHEVVIETPRHEETLATLPLKGVKNVLRAYRERIIDLRRDQRLRYVLVFKNHGVAAGASLGTFPFSDHRPSDRPEESERRDRRGENLFSL